MFRIFGQYKFITWIYVRFSETVLSARAWYRVTVPQSRFSFGYPPGLFALALPSFGCGGVDSSPRTDVPVRYDQGMIPNELIGNHLPFGKARNPALRVIKKQKLDSCCKHSSLMLAHAPSRIVRDERNRSTFLSPLHCRRGMK